MWGCPRERNPANHREKVFPTNVGLALNVKILVYVLIHIPHACEADPNVNQITHAANAVFSTSVELALVD